MWHVTPLRQRGPEQTAHLDCAKSKVRETQEENHKQNNVNAAVAPASPALRTIVSLFSKLLPLNFLV